MTYEEPTDDDIEFLNNIDRMQEEEEAAFARNVEKQADEYFRKKHRKNKPVNRLICHFDGFHGFRVWLLKKGIRW